MSNPLFQSMGQSPSGNPFGQIMQRFQQFQRMFHGDPQQQVQALLNSGKVSQEQYNRAVQMANQMQKLMGGKM